MDRATGPATRPRATFGLIISANYPDEQDLGARLAEHREQIKLAREAGFTSVVASHHFLMRPVTALATIPYLASMIDISGDMKLATGVMLLPLLHPVTLAEEFATLDWLSGGRAIVGLAMGYRRGAGGRGGGGGGRAEGGLQGQALKQPHPAGRPAPEAAAPPADLDRGRRRR